MKLAHFKKIQIVTEMYKGSRCLTHAFGKKI
jgi:hypothetical protein